MGPAACRPIARCGSGALLAAVAVGLLLGGLAGHGDAEGTQLARLAPGRLPTALAPAVATPPRPTLPPPMELRRPAAGPLPGVRRPPLLAAVAAAAVYPTAALAAEIDPWSLQLQDLGPQLFSLSLLPYLAFLFFLSRREVPLPRGALLGFTFLLVFVVGTIPASIFARVQYDDIIPNVDWLHGLVQLPLTVTNLLTVLGLRAAMPRQTPSPAVVLQQSCLLSLFQAQDVFLFGSALAGMGAVVGAWQGGLLGLEPGNALSVPTWALHVASVVEYAVAMGLVWDLADLTGRPEWRGLTFGMLPLFAGGIGVCVYHAFYNAPALDPLITLQAVLTCLGNSTCAFAAWRVWRAGKRQAAADALRISLTPPRPTVPQIAEVAGLTAPAAAWPSPSPAVAPLAESDGRWFARLTAISVFGALAIKYGELFLATPFQPETGLPIALAIIALPTAAAAAFFYGKSRRRGFSTGGQGASEWL